MEYLLVIIASLLASLLTFFSGFGLGTILMPVFALFFPVEIAIACTAIVHGLNSLFKAIILWRDAHRPTLLRFLPLAIIGAVVGASLLAALGSHIEITTYTLGGREWTVTGVKAVIGTVMLVFAVLELTPAMDRLEFSAKWVPIGGALSGFFGGLSGHQGALRTAFLVRTGLTKEQLVGTNAVCALCIDAIRLAVYMLPLFLLGPWRQATGTQANQQSVISTSELPITLIICGTLAALIGTVAGRRLFKTVTIRAVRVCVGVLLLVMSLAMIAGVV